MLLIKSYDMYGLSEPRCMDKCISGWGFYIFFKVYICNVECICIAKLHMYIFKNMHSMHIYYSRTMKRQHVRNDFIPYCCSHISYDCGNFAHNFLHVVVLYIDLGFMISMKDFGRISMEDFGRLRQWNTLKFKSQG